MFSARDRTRRPKISLPWRLAVTRERVPLDIVGWEGIARGPWDDVRREPGATDDCPPAEGR